MPNLTHLHLNILRDSLSSIIKDIFPVLETFKYTIYSPNNQTITNNYPALLRFSDVLRSDVVPEINQNKNQSLYDINVLYKILWSDLSKLNLLEIYKVDYLKMI
jgi:hypothetical protein